MSRSYKKAIYKDKAYKKDIYWRIVRSHWKTLLNSGVDPMDLPHPREIINDWDYCDYILDYEHSDNNDWWSLTEDEIKQLKRK